MKYLVLCDCAHTLDHHGAEGCAGDGIKPCACSKNEDGALEAAVDQARWQPCEDTREPAELA